MSDTNSTAFRPDLGRIGTMFHSHRRELREVTSAIDTCAELLREAAMEGDDDGEPFFSQRDVDGVLTLIKIAARHQYLFIARVMGEDDAQLEDIEAKAIKKHLADTAPPSGE